MVAPVEICQSLLPLGCTLVSTFLHGFVQFVFDFARLRVRQGLIVALHQMGIGLAIKKDDLLSLGLRGLYGAVGV